MAIPSLHVSIDGKWIQCRPTEEFGVIGNRFLCDFGTESQQPAKRLLLRPLTWSRPGVPEGSPLDQLSISTVLDSAKLGLRPVRTKNYQQAIPQTNGKFRQSPCQLVQQDITGLASIKQAVEDLVKNGEVRRIWQLFYKSCKALDEFGCNPPSNKPVHLQFPQSLAIDLKRRVILLDAEVQVFSPPSSQALVRQFNTTWFGTAGSNGFANSDDAFVLHARALQRYFIELLTGLQPQMAPDQQPVLADIIAQFRQFQPGSSLADFESWIQNHKREDWNILDEDEGPTADSSEKAPPLSPPASRKKRPLLQRLSLFLNLILIVAIIILWFWPRYASTTEAKPTVETVLLLSSYAVVFPTQGTIPDKVSAALEDLFPNRIREIKSAARERGQLLEEKMTEAIKGLDDSGKLKELLARLADKHSVRFKGFSAADTTVSLSTIIERGGMYTISSGSQEQHGSLLQSNGLDKVLDQSGMAEQQEARALLGSLKKAIADFASLKDALSIIGDRSAFILRVEPTESAHSAVRRQLLSRLDKPVFMSRPIPALFDAVDPTADTGGGFASYSLVLERKCYWRLASQQDRKDVDYAKNTSNDQVKWRSFDAGKPITWNPIPLKKRTGRTDVVSSFDIAVVKGETIVVFRNQNFFVDNSRQKAIEQGRDYVNTYLGLGVQSIEDAVKVTRQNEQFTGTLSYSYLAELVKTDRTDVEIVAQVRFDQIRSKEDEFAR